MSSTTYWFSEKVLEIEVPGVFSPTPEQVHAPQVQVGPWPSDTDITWSFRLQIPEMRGGCKGFPTCPLPHGGPAMTSHWDPLPTCSLHLGGLPSFLAALMT